MVPLAQSVQGDLWGFRAPPSRSLRYSCKCQAASVHLPCSESNGFEAGCFSALLGPYVSLCLSAICLLQQVLSRVLFSTGLSLILVALLWLQKEWYADLLSLLVDESLELRQIRNLLVPPHTRTFHRSLGTLHLHTWRLSSDSSASGVF